MYIWQLIHTLPVEKAGNFPFQKGKKEILKNFPKYKSIAYSKLLIDCKQLLWNILLLLTEHNPSFALFLICSYFFTQSELRYSYSYKVCSYLKKMYSLGKATVLKNSKSCALILRFLKVLAKSLKSIFVSVSWSKFQA